MSLDSKGFGRFLKRGTSGDQSPAEAPLHAADAQASYAHASAVSYDAVTGEVVRGEAITPTEPAPGHVADPALPVEALPTEVIETRPARRGGRNLYAASAVGTLLLVGILFAAWWSTLVFAIVLYVFCIGAVFEWRAALKKHRRTLAIEPIIAATIGMGIATWFAQAEGLAVALLVACAGVVAWRIVDERVENTMADSIASMLTLMWIPFLASFVLLMQLADNGWARVFVLIVAVTGNDTGALYTGMRFGKRKLAPAISPNKTVEGAIGGIVVGTVAASICAFILMDGAWWQGALVGLACTIAAIIGDLAESAIKRDIEVKDMSSFIPGHGGILDRLDSMLVAAPVAYVVFALLMGTR